MKNNETVSLYLDTATHELVLGARVGHREEVLPLGSSKSALERTNVGIEVLGKDLGFALADVDAFYCLLGPGSNTGIRLGLTVPRTVYAFNPKIRLFGARTLDVYLAGVKEGAAALSDRAGNLFFAQKKDGKNEMRKIARKEIGTSLPKETKIRIEKADELARLALKDYPVDEIVPLEEMMAHPEAFEDYSSREEAFLPAYASSL